MKRISIRDNVFHKLVNGQESLIDSEVLDVIIINAAVISRMYYPNEYDPNKTSSPVCWSSDTRNPDPDVICKQSYRCMDCEQDIKGSGVGNSRACKFSQKIAVTIEDNLYDIYQLQLPATSLFGSAKRGWMSMQNYAKHLASHDTSAMMVVTRICFEHDGYAPRLRFRPMRVLDEAELEVVAELENHPDTLKAITMVAPEPSYSASPFEKVDGFVFNKAT